MTSTWLPYVNPVTGESQRGVSCKGCQVAVKNKTQGLSGPNRLYSREEFLGHFRDCGAAKELWLASEGGTVEVEEPENGRGSEDYIKCMRHSCWGSSCVSQWPGILYLLQPGLKKARDGRRVGDSMDAIKRAAPPAYPAAIGPSLNTDCEDGARNTYR